MPVVKPITPKASRKIFRAQTFGVNACWEYLRVGRISIINRVGWIRNCHIDLFNGHKEKLSGRVKVRIRIP